MIRPSWSSMYTVRPSVQARSAAGHIGRSAPGGPHAEVVALGRALKRHGARAVSRASLAVTLEPCCFTGRTGACTDAILAAGVRRVYVGCRDPHPRVAGRGLRILREAGVEVVTGILESECRDQHRGFLSLCERGRPFVTGALDGGVRWYLLVAALLVLAVSGAGLATNWVAAAYVFLGAFMGIWAPASPYMRATAAIRVSNRSSGLDFIVLFSL